MNAPPEFSMDRLEGDMIPPPADGSLNDDLFLGYTMFDVPGSDDGSILALIQSNRIHSAPAQALVRIESRDDQRNYLAVVSAGPFAIPDSLKADSAVLIAVGTHGASYLPPYHGRVELTLMGERLEDGTLIPARFRPRPQSKVFRLDATESAKALKAEGNLRLGTAIGIEELEVRVPSDDKAVLPRHLAVLGTTGGGKSNTIATLIQQAQAAGMCVILLDVEGEYTAMHEPATEKKLLASLENRKLSAKGIPVESMSVYHLVKRECANPRHPNLRPFSLQFARLSPYAINEILDLSDAQQERFLKAYDIAKEVMRELNIFPAKNNAEQERMAMELDEFDRGYPRMTLPLLLDVIDACMARAESSGASRSKKKDDDEGNETFSPKSPQLDHEAGRKALRTRMHSANPPGNVISWRAVRGRFGRLNRLGVFYDEDGGVKPIHYAKLLQPGHLSVIDLSDSGFSELNNLVIADLLRGIQAAQDELVEQATEAGRPIPPTLVIVEEAHEFLSEERIGKMPVLFEQVAKIAKRGRKRWIGLTFVTQLPQHLPKQVFGLCNSYILHKLTDPAVISTLKRTVGSVDEGLWVRLPTLAPGQAITSFPHFTRPLLTSIDPTGCKLRMAE